MFDLYPADLATLKRDKLERTIQQRTQTVYLGDGVVLARILTRYKMLLHTSDRGFAGHVMMDGYWEIWLTRFFARIVKPGMRVADVGANYGYYTMLFADIVTRSGRVLAVEPNPAAADLLRQSLQLNGFDYQTVLVEAALGASATGEAQLLVPYNEPKNAHLSGAPGYPGTSHTVALTSLDRLASQFGPIDLVKIDAEGAEVGIIAGMQDLLDSGPPDLVLEFNAARCADPAGFLGHLLRIYGGVATIGFDAETTPAAPETLLTTQVGEDWLLFFSRRNR
jgi:FkbM family methyltransferase